MTEQKHFVTLVVPDKDQAVLEKILREQFPDVRMIEKTTRPSFKMPEIPGENEPRRGFDF